MMIDGCDLSAESATASEWSSLTSSESPPRPPCPSVMASIVYCVLSFTSGSPASPFGTSIFAPRRHSPREKVAPFFTVTGAGPRRLAAGLRTNGVRPKAPILLLRLCWPWRRFCLKAEHQGPSRRFRKRFSCLYYRDGNNCKLFSPSPLE